MVVAINARVADGRDPSWLWDVPFECLRGRTVVATGDRCRDLAVRLHYAEVPHATVPDPVAAVRAAAAPPGGGAPSPPDGAGDDRWPVVEFIGNYTAFADMLAQR